LRQDILTNLPLQPLCEAACPGLCPRCGQRLDSHHARHASPEEDEEAAANSASPFARLAVLLQNDEENS
jgi:uncharacterized metal-binding protein YceD (DUF177 family)